MKLIVFDMDQTLVNVQHLEANFAVGGWRMETGDYQVINDAFPSHVSVEGR